MSRDRSAAFSADVRLAAACDASAFGVAEYNAAAHSSVTVHKGVTAYGSIAGETHMRGAPSRKVTGRPSFRRDEGGSLTVEALLILPVILLLMVLFVRWGIILRDDLRSAAEARHTVRQQDSLGAGFGGTDAGGTDAGAADTGTNGAVGTGGETNGAGANGARVTDSGEASFGFLLGGPPARRIRDADLLIYWGYAIKEKLPGWIKSIIQ